MADDLTDPGPEDGLRINLNQDHEVRYWTKALDCTEEELRTAVGAVGVMADDVRKYLAQDLDTQPDG